jgi:hypothetical protein
MDPGILPAFIGVVVTQQDIFLHLVEAERLPVDYKLLPFEHTVHEWVDSAPVISD